MRLTEFYGQIINGLKLNLNFINRDLLFESF